MSGRGPEFPPVPLSKRLRRPQSFFKKGKLDWLDTLDEYEQLCRVRLQHLVRVDQPLVLVSQMPRSGGTLLSQLFDGNPELHAHPYELNIGHPRINRWPPLDLSAGPEAWFEMLWEKQSAGSFLRGYQKSLKRRHEYDVFPFTFLPKLQRRIFESVVAEGVERPRDILDAYFTSYFNAWLDNQNLYSGPKKAVAGFAPRLVMSPKSVHMMFVDYPDGTLISIIRDPRGWYRAMRGWLGAKYEGEQEKELRQWQKSTQSALDAREWYGDKVLIVTFEQLVRETEATMNRIAERIGITPSPELYRPTFNGRDIRANSSEPVTQYGVLTDRADLWREELEPKTIAWVEEQCGELYERAAGVPLPA